MQSFKVIKSNLISIKTLLNNQSIRYYRFGNSVYRNGFYYSQKNELNKQYLRSDENKLSSEELRKKRNKLFDNEKKRQKELVNRIEKIEVQVINPFGDNENITLIMNKEMSTPYHCCQHIHQILTDRTVIAKVDDNTYWDMNRPLVSDCKLHLCHFKDKNPYLANKAFWRSCSLILGSVIENAFKSEIQVSLHSWPKPDPNSGSFVYDVVINLDNWKPQQEESRVLTAMFRKIVAQELSFERLDVNICLAKEMFEHNSFKSEQIDSISSSKNQEFVTLYRIGDQIDISCGPMISNTSQIGANFVTAIHPIKTEFGPMFRFQGIAIPKQLNLNTFVFSILRERAKKLNACGLSSKYYSIENNEQQKSENIDNNEFEIKEKVMV